VRAVTPSFASSLSFPYKTFLNKNKNLSHNNKAIFHYEIQAIFEQKNCQHKDICKINKQNNNKG